MVMSSSIYIFREIQEGDEEDIVNLLKLCLGDSPHRSEKFWNWKHKESFFGPSYVLLAFTGSQLIGIRAFMRWQWGKGDKIYQCVRAVDAATHPEYQRQGLFLKLTYSLIEKMKADGVDFIFNTPNNMSGAGNLKMGWKVLGKTKLVILPSRFDKIVANRINEKFTNVIFEEDAFEISEELEKIMLVHLSKRENKLKKVISLEYLKWRYQDIPYYNYGLKINEKSDFAIIFRVLERGKIRELRIVDLFLKNINMGYLENELKVSIKKLLYSYHCDVATLSCEDTSVISNIVKNGRFINLGPKGLNVFLRSLNLNIDELLIMHNWDYSTGDIEIF